MSHLTSRSQAARRGSCFSPELRNNNSQAMGSGKNGDRIKNSANGEEPRMLYWALIFLVVAIIAAVLGFTGIAIISAGIAKLLFFIFLVLFIITLVAHLGRRGRPI